MEKNQTIYVRVAPRAGAEKFFRCGEEFTREWRRLEGVDAATVARFLGEQMLEVSDQQPGDYVPDADQQAAAERAAAEQAAAERAAAEQATAERAAAEQAAAEKAAAEQAAAERAAAEQAAAEKAASKKK